MLATCSRNDGGCLPDSCVDERAGWTRDKIYSGLEVGVTYVVYVVRVDHRCKWFYVCRAASWYPTPYPEPMFDVVDSTPPACWNEVSHPHGLTIRAFPEWASDPLFYAALLDNDPAATATWCQYKMEIDAANPGGFTGPDST